MCWQGYGIGDHFRDGAYGGSKDTGAVLEKAVTQLGLQPHTIEQTVRTRLINPRRHLFAQAPSVSEPLVRVRCWTTATR